MKPLTLNGFISWLEKLRSKETRTACSNLHGFIQSYFCSKIPAAKSARIDLSKKQPVIHIFRDQKHKKKIRSLKLSDDFWFTFLELNKEASRACEDESLALPLISAQTALDTVQYAHRLRVRSSDHFAHAAVFPGRTNKGSQVDKNYVPPLPGESGGIDEAAVCRGFASDLASGKQQKEVTVPAHEGFKWERVKAGRLRLCRDSGGQSAVESASPNSEDSNNSEAPDLGAAEVQESANGTEGTKSSENDIAQSWV